MKPILLLGCVVLSCLSAVAAEVPESESPTALEALRTFIAAQKEAGAIDLDQEGWRQRLPKFPEAPFREDAAYQWILETDAGTITAELYPQHAPQHVRNILYLSELGFYDGIVFHRIIPGFMAQGGDPTGTGRGGPGYSIRLEAKRDVKHDARGVLSMARSMRPDSAGSQFFITFGPTPNLDGGYTVFGRVVDGMEVLKALEAAGNPDPRANGVPPKEEIRIRAASVRPAPGSADDNE